MTEHVNVVFIGHVDHGKSTTAGQILLLTGCVDERTIEKYKLEAKENNRESWYIAYIMDTSEDERARGKTVEVGHASFTTATKKFTILDAPGHKGYIPNMIAGASQADVAVLVVSALCGEFEAGFEKGGQTKEHVILARTLGITRMVLLVNKMDSVQWSKERYDEIVSAVSKYIRNIGITNITCIPASSLHAINIAVRDNSVSEWYIGPALLEHLDSMPPIPRLTESPFRMPVNGITHDRGVHVLTGKIEAGVVKVGVSIIIAPSNEIGVVENIIDTHDTTHVTLASAGWSVELHIRGLSAPRIGDLICASDCVAPITQSVIAQIVILQLPNNKPLIACGYTAVMHIHSCVAPVTVESIQSTKYLKNGDSGQVKLQFQTRVALEKFETIPQLGRFTIRDEGYTVAFGKILKIGITK